ncbi:MAG: nucleotidyltransferase domain-containing protein [Campylobacterota bacterium]|nr:nucleotidyltransferase domain-containing protein [Campylobacterota bacterium]
MKNLYLSPDPLSIRLKSTDITSIKNVAQKIYGDALVWIFGSRADSSKKGGDIDIFIKSNHNQGLKDKLKFIGALQRLIGDRKIDLIVQTPNSRPRAIFKTAIDTGVRL